jgi:hypothetical protein
MQGLDAAHRYKAELLEMIPSQQIGIKISLGSKIYWTSNDIVFRLRTPFWLRFFCLALFCLTERWPFQFDSERSLRTIDVLV